jgi:Iron-sulfur cluster-binding domain
MPCRVGMRDFFIRTYGDIEVCFFYPPIGNIKEASAREIWYGAKAAEIRKQTVECDRLCLYACLSQKTLSEFLLDDFNRHVRFIHKARQEFAFLSQKVAGKAGFWTI